MRPAEALSLALAALVLLLALRMAVLDYRIRRKLQVKGGRRVPGFDAATVVEPLDWTFEPFVRKCAGGQRPASDGEPPGQQCADPAGCPNGPGPHLFIASSRGVIAEPDDGQIKRYLAAVKEMGEEIRAKVPDAPEGSDPADLMAALDNLDLDSVAELTGKMAAVVAALCSDDPSPASILALPPRRRTMFYGWLQQEVMAPEAAPAAGNAQVRTLRSAAGG